MLEINENGKIEGREMHLKLESKTAQYSIWVNRAIEDADLQDGKDFYTILYKSTGGRPKKEYEFTIDAAKEICLLERNKKGKEIRKWLISLSNQRENLELITIKESAFAFKVINCLKYIENQKTAYSLHQASFIDNMNTPISKHSYSEFAKYRASIVGWDKHKVDEAISLYLQTHAGYNNSKLSESNMQTKLSVMDIGEAIRVACLDLLYSKETDENLSNRFSELCKKLAHEMKVVPEKKNESNLFKQKEDMESLLEINSNMHHVLPC